MISLFFSSKSKILPLYFLKGFLKYFFSAASVFVSVMLMASFLSIINEDGVMNGFSHFFLIKSLIWLLPSMAASSLPFAFVMGFMLSFSEFESFGELKAAMSAGFSQGELFKQVFLFSIFLSLSVFVLNSWIGPIGAGRSREYVRNMFGKTTNISFSGGTFETVSGLSVYARKVSKTGRLEGIKIFKKEKEDNSLFSIISSSGYIETLNQGVSVKLNGGFMSFFSFEKTKNYYFGKFENYETFMPYENSLTNERKKPLREMTSSELFKNCVEGSAEALAAARQIFFRFVLAFSPAVFFFCAFSLSVFFSKSGKFWAFALSLVCVFAYYGFSSVCDAVSSKWPLLFPWINTAPLFLFGVPGYLVFNKIERRG
ncbi:MAG: LptF/LptG family permease [Elusimicrobiota bacterium]